jgi:thioredoxin-related protein
MKSLERAANISIFFAVIIFLSILIRNEVIHKTNQPTGGQALSRVAENKKISIPEIPFPREHEVLLMALSTNCHFCKESSPFYRDLDDRKKGKIEIIAAFPQSLDVIKSYMKDEGLASDQVISRPLDQIGILATPTLLLLDKSGTVKKMWVGYLDTNKQQEVYNFTANQ